MGLTMLRGPFLGGERLGGPHPGRLVQRYLVGRVANVNPERHRRLTPLARRTHGALQAYDPPLAVATPGATGDSAPLPVPPRRPHIAVPATSSLFAAIYHSNEPNPLAFFAGGSGALKFC